MTSHNLKIDVAPFDDLLSGAKTCEVRNDDRGFVIDDIVHLTCSDGRTTDRTISHIQRGYGLPDGICVLSYTRATPSADPLAGLQRYWLSVRDRGTYSDAEMLVDNHNGEYVLPSEAAKVIDLMKHDEVSYRSTIEHLKQRAEAAEAKLAKYEHQLPIGYITPKAQLSLLQEFSTSDSISQVKMGECRIAIYDSPAPVSDGLQEKCERYEQALDRISKMDRSHGSWDTIAYDAVNIAGSALSSIATHNNTT